MGYAGRRFIGLRLAGKRYLSFVEVQDSYELVSLRNGARSIRSRENGETMHPGLGPVAEARSLYVDQIGLPERFRDHDGEFVVWDVGLGAAANALTVLRSLRELDGRVRVVSFEHTLEPLRFAYGHRETLTYFAGYETAVAELLSTRASCFRDERSEVSWELRLVDFPTFLKSAEAEQLAKPHVVLFDPWSPARNPSMWTAPLFANLHRLLDPGRPCVLPTYSRSTMLRVTLLLAGFFVGRGHATGLKEETTLAANHSEMLDDLLDARWLERARRSKSAEPLWEPSYRQAPLASDTEARLILHPQFKSPKA